MKCTLPVCVTATVIILCAADQPLKAQVSAASTSAATITTTSVTQGFDWTTPNNAQTADGVYTTSQIVGSNRSTYYLDAKNWGFQSSVSGQANYIPPAATINGIEVFVVHRKSGAGSVRDNRIILLKAGAESGTNKARGTLWPTTASTVKFGSSVDMWGTTWTVADLTNANFGIRVSARNKGNKTAQAEIDHIRITVYFNQTFYYSKTTGNLELPATWGLNADGTGTTPVNFTANGQVFFLKGRAAASLTANLTISGTNSKMVVGDGVSATALTIPSNFALNAVVDIAAGSSLIINNTTIPTLGSIGTNSTVTYGATANQNVTEASYHNLTLSGSGDKLLQAGTTGITTVNNVLTIDAGINFNNQGHNVVVLGSSNGISNSGTASGAGRFIYSLSDVSTSITGGGPAVYSNLEMDFTSTTGATRTLTLGNAATVTGSLYLTDGTFANGSNLTMTAASAIVLADGILNSTITSGNSYDVTYSPYTTASPKTTGNELSGTLNNLTLQTGSGLAINLNRNITLGGNLAITSGTLDPTTTNYNVTLAGNFTNNGTLTSRNNVITFNGNSTQTINGSATQNFYDLAVNKTGAGRLQLNTPVAVSHTLTLTSGIITTSTTNFLSLTTDATIAGGSTTSHVEGPLSYAVDALSGIRTFPLGKNNVYRPLSLNITQVSASPTTYTAEVFAGAPPARTFPAAINKVSAIRYYTINSSNNGNLTSAAVTLNYGADDGVTDPANLRIAKSNGGVWENIGGTGTAPGTGSITSGNFTSFSDFALANAVGGLNPLPLHWISFKAERNSRGIKLTWQTQNEEHVSHMEIQRRNSMGVWEELNSMPARNELLNDYTYTDITPLADVNFYRIRSVDLDGGTSYSAIVSARAENGAMGISLAPNPVTGNRFICRINNAGILRGKTISVQLFDATGKLVLARSITPRAVTEVQLPPLTKGIYWVNIRAAGTSYNDQLIVH